MRIKNSLNYPDSVLKAANEHLYKPSWDKIRVSELLSGLLKKYLLIKHWDSLEVEADDLLLSLLGTAWHQFLSGWSVDNEIHNYRWYAKINDQPFSGETDVYKITPDGGIIEDNKVTSAWSFVFGRKEWEAQLNSYAYLISENQYSVRGLRINAFLRDWSKWDLVKDRKGNYPKNKFFCLEVPLWPKEKQLEYLTKRLELHKLARDAFTNEAYGINYAPFECTPEERWQSKEQFAVTKKNNKNAAKLCRSMDEAQKYIAAKFKKPADYEVIHRIGSNKLCQDYCLVRSICPCKGE